MLTGSYHYPHADGVVFGKPWAEALAVDVERLGARRVFAVLSGTLARAFPLEESLRSALGETFVGATDGVRAHSPREDVALVAAKARDAGADLLVAIGGGSVIDATKVVQLCLAHGVYDPEAFDTIRSGAKPPLPYRDLAVRLIAIPSTLSGAELSNFAGVTNTARKRKEMYGHIDMAPRVVILDPRVTVETPEELWLSTGIRAVDHAVEDICSINSQPFADAASAKAIKLLASGLKRTKADPADLDARLDSLIGVWLSMTGTQGGVEKGVSHAIGHVLGGTAGVPHGLTSCITLPHVLRWNKSVNAGQQKTVAEAFGDPDADAGDLVADLIESLGLPHTLQAVGVSRDQLQTIAELTMRDPWTPTNPRKVNGPADVMAILEKAW